MKISLTESQIKFVIEKTAISDRIEAVQYFADLMRKERIDPSEMVLYVTRMMSKEKKK